MSKTIKLDPRHLLGFRILGSGRAAVKLGGKIGSKTGSS